MGVVLEPSREVKRAIDEIVFDMTYIEGLVDEPLVKASLRTHFFFALTEQKRADQTISLKEEFSIRNSPCFLRKIDNARRVLALHGTYACKVEIVESSCHVIGTGYVPFISRGQVDCRYASLFSRRLPKLIQPSALRNGVAR